MIHWTRFVGLFLGSRQTYFDILQYEHGSKLNTCLSFYPGVFTTRHNTAQAISPYYSDQIRAVSDRCHHYCKTHFPFPYNSSPGLEKSLRPNQVLDLLDTEFAMSARNSQTRLFQCSGITQTGCKIA